MKNRTPLHERIPASERDQIAVKRAYPDAHIEADARLRLFRVKAGDRTVGLGSSPKAAWQHARERLERA